MILAQDWLFWSLKFKNSTSEPLDFETCLVLFWSLATALVTTDYKSLGLPLQDAETVTRVEAGHMWALYYIAIN